MIRLYAGTRSRSSTTSTGWSAPPPRSSSSFDRAALESEIEALLAELGDADGQLRLIVTRGGRRLAMTEPIPAHAAEVSVATVTYSPDA